MIPLLQQIVRLMDASLVVVSFVVFFFFVGYNWKLPTPQGSPIEQTGKSPLDDSQISTRLQQPNWDSGGNIRSLPYEGQPSWISDYQVLLSLEGNLRKRTNEQPRLITGFSLAEASYNAPSAISAGTAIIRVAPKDLKFKAVGFLLREREEKPWVHPLTETDTSLQPNNYFSQQLAIVFPILEKGDTIIVLIRLESSMQQQPDLGNIQISFGASKEIA